MLEIKNITKTYRPKKGVPVRALDNVSLSFADRGLVFILGKSGSGKSTLLNVVGGLDKADSGEFIIKGKSSKDFSHGDFDAYRNTFIGFIFQEYNILKEFSVGQNIALAMELQGKKATKEALRDILEEVDLQGYENRKTNELSGGQKQRIAIARALIKQPEIIMADEPTGALDSNTGKQVFDTLKKLSQTKLVIVVSHDREFAEYYGDRVIELADGKIISDISKYETSPVAKSPKVSIIDDKIVHVKRGSELTDADFEIIRQYIKNIHGDILISADDRSNESLKQIAMITDEGNKVLFKDTTEENTPKLNYKPEDSKFINSRLPYRNALKIGASSIKTKPIRLFFTILLSFISFAMFGMADTFGSYNKVTAAATSIVDSNISYASFVMQENIQMGNGDYSYMMSNNVMGDNNSKAELEKQTGLKMYPVYRGLDNIDGSLIIPGLKNTYSSSYYLPLLAGITEIGKSEIDAMNYTVTGRMPEADNEIAITKYQYDVYNFNGFTPIRQDESSIEVGALTLNTSSSNSIIGKHIKLNINASDYTESINNMEFEIVGVVDTKIGTKYESLKELNDSSSFSDYVTISEFNTMITTGIHGMMFVNSGVIDAAVTSNVETKSGTEYSKYVAFKPLQDNYNSKGVEISNVLDLSSVTDSDNIIWLDETKTTLSDKDVILPMIAFDELLQWMYEMNISFPVKSFYSSEYDEDASDYKTYEYNGSTLKAVYINHLMEDALVRYVKENGVPDSFKELKRSEGIGYPDTDSYYITWEIEYIRALTGWNSAVVTSYTSLYKIGAEVVAQALAKFVQECNIVNFSSFALLKDSSLRSYPEWIGDSVNIVGFRMGESVMDYSDTTMIISDSFMEEIKNMTQSYYVGFVGAMPSSSEDVQKIVKYSYDNENKAGVQFVLHNQVITSLASINDIIESISSVFLYVGIGLAVFSALLLSNFIAVSIANKKREIGILRAVGAKSRDVFTIFFNESIIIALINFALALVGAITTCIAFNSFFMSEIGVSITILSFGIRQVALMFLVSVGVALVASFFPVMSIARKQPIDSIQDR